MKQKLNLPSLLAMVIGLLAGLALLFAAPARSLADTLETRTGRILRGKYLGGTQKTLRFLSGGKVLVFRVGEVLALTFQGPAQASPPKGVNRTELKPPPGKDKRVKTTAPDRVRTKAVAKTPVGGMPRLLAPAGQEIKIRLGQMLSSSTTRPGFRFSGRLAEPLRAGGKATLAPGATVVGRVVDVKAARLPGEKAKLVLELVALRVGRVLVGAKSEKKTIWGKPLAPAAANPAAGGSKAKSKRQRPFALPWGARLSFKLLADLRAVPMAAPAKQPSRRGGRLRWGKTPGKAPIRPRSR